MAIDKTQLKAHLQNNPSDSLWDDLVGAWFFDEGSGTTVEDSFGSNNGTINLAGTRTASWTSDGYSIQQTSGGPSSVNLVSTPSPTGNEYTILLLIKCDSTKFSNANSNIAACYAFGIIGCVNSATENLVVSVTGGTINVANDDSLMTLFAVRTGATETKVYKDDLLYDTGAELNGTGPYLMRVLEGTHLEIGLYVIWDRYLTDDEITTIIDNDYEDPYNPIPTIARQIAERNNKIIGGKQTVY